MAAITRIAWAEAFAGIMPASIEPPTQDAWRTRLSSLLDEPGVRLTVAELGGRASGYASYGPSRDSGARQEVAELRSIYVDAVAWGQGIGTALIERALAHLAADDYREVTLWSFADNHRAGGFYEGHGFRRDGSQQRRERHGGALEVRYRGASYTGS